MRIRPSQPKKPLKEVKKVQVPIKRLIRDKGEPSKCSFCGGCLSIKSSFYNCVSTNNKTVMCSNCLERFASLANIGKVHLKYWRENRWNELEEKMNRSVLTQYGSIKVKRTVVRIAMKLAMLAGARMNGAKNAFTRVVLNSKSPDRFIDLLSTACRDAGVIVVKATKRDYLAGTAQAELRHHGVNDSSMYRHGVIVITDGVVEEKTPYCSMIFFSEEGVDLDGFDSSELS